MLHQVQTWRAMCTDACRKGSHVQSRLQLYYRRLFTADSLR